MEEKEEGGDGYPRPLWKRSEAGVGAIFGTTWAKTGYQGPRPCRVVLGGFLRRNLGAVMGGFWGRLGAFLRPSGSPLGSIPS